MEPGKNVVIRTLGPDRWREAGALAGRAFWTEDYMAVLADDPLERFAVVQDLYLRMQLSDSTTTLAAFAGDHVVGIACVERGDCFFCGLDPDAEVPADRVGAVMHGVDQAIRRLHAGPARPRLHRTRRGGAHVAGQWHRRGAGGGRVRGGRERSPADGRDRLRPSAAVLL